MILRRVMISYAASLLFFTSVQAQADVKHFAQDGLSFDYPANWQLTDRSSPQMQYLQLSRAGDADIRIRAPREPIDTPAKEAEAMRIVHQQYLDEWVKNLQKMGMHAEPSDITTEISGGPAKGARLHVVLDGEPGGVDVYWRLVSNRFVQLTIVGSDAQIKNSAVAWNTIRNSLKIEPPPQPQPKPKPSPQ